MMPEYLVVWEIDVEADSPGEAASKARYYQQKPDTTATVFDVYERGNHPSDTVLVAHVDLSEPEDTRHFWPGDRLVDEETRDDDCVVVCPQCGATSGDSWSKCPRYCPMPMSPYFVDGTSFAAEAKRRLKRLEGE